MSRVTNFILKLVIDDDGSVISDEEGPEGVITAFFYKRFSPLYSKVTWEMNSFLSCPYDVEEVRYILKSLHPNKALGLLWESSTCHRVNL